MNDFETDHIVLESELDTMCDLLNSYNDELLLMRENPSAYFQEAGNKPSIGQRIWEFLKSVVRKLVSVLKWIGRKIRSLFKKGKQSIDQIVEKCGIAPKRRMTQEAVAAPPKEETIHFPASKESFLQETDLVTAVKRLLIAIEGNRFVASVPGIQEGLNYKGPHRTNNWEVNYYAACAVITESSLHELLFDIADKIIYDSEHHELVEIKQGFIDDVNKLDAKAYDDSNASKYAKGVPFNNSDFTSFQSKLTEATHKIDQVQSIEGISDDLLEALNKFADVLIGVTYGMNEFNRAVNQLYMIDGRFIAAVNKAEDLDVFVFQCIKSGIHPKFIAYNTWLLLDNSWKSNTKLFYTKDIRPTWGQTRTVFDIKGMDVVVKLAMSGAGIMGNKNEIAITKEFKQHNVEDMIACVEEYMTNSAVIFPRAIVSYIQPSQDDLYEYKEKLKDLYWDYPDLHDIRGDVHIGNIGFDTSRHVVCIDYGNAPIKKR